MTFPNNPTPGHRSCCERSDCSSSIRSTLCPRTRILLLPEPCSTRRSNIFSRWTYWERPSSGQPYPVHHCSRAFEPASDGLSPEPRRFKSSDCHRQTTENRLGETHTSTGQSTSSDRRGVYPFTRDILSGPHPVTVFILDVTTVFVLCSIYLCVWLMRDTLSLYDESIIWLLLMCVVFVVVYAPFKINCFSS